MCSLEGDKKNGTINEENTPSFPSQGVNELNCLFWKLLKGLIVQAFLASVGYVGQFPIENDLKSCLKASALCCVQMQIPFGVPVYLVAFLLKTIKSPLAFLIAGSNKRLTTLRFVLN